MITISYFKVNSVKPENVKCQDEFDVVNYLIKIDPLPLNTKVYLATCDGANGEVYISQNFNTIVDLIPNHMLPIKKGCTIYIQEYSNYEDAYAVALSMRESNPLCYES
jgi:hypothetical protein